MDRTDAHYTIITKHLTDGNVVPFLGAGANLCGRLQGAGWRQGAGYLPSGRELAALLATGYDFPRREVKLHCPKCEAQLKMVCPEHGEMQVSEEAQDLLRIAQYVANASGPLQLYEDLHKLFAALPSHIHAPLPGVAAGDPEREELSAARTPGSDHQL